MQIHKPKKRDVTSVHPRVGGPVQAGQGHSPRVFAHRDPSGGVLCRGQRLPGGLWWSRRADPGAGADRSGSRADRRTCRAHRRARTHRGAAAGGPKYGGTIRCSMQVIRIDHPARYSWVYDSNATRHFLEYLTQTDNDNITHPMLLESWKPSDDLKTWDLILRKGIKLNNGDEFTADDVLFNFKEWLDPEVGSSMIGKLPYLQITGVEKVDDYHVRLNLDTAAISVPEDLFHYPAQILHRGFEGDIVAQPVGTGPFTLQEYAVGERCVLKRREDYWGKDEAGQPTALPGRDHLRRPGRGPDPGRHGPEAGADRHHL